MGLKQRLQDDLAAAMRSGEVTKRDVLRLMRAAIKQAEVDGGGPLDEEGTQAVLVKQAKERRESIADYQGGGREDLVAQEQAALSIIESYLPQMMTREEIAEIAAGVIAQLGADSEAGADPRAIGQVMSRLMPQLRGKAEGRLVNEVVRDLLQNP